MSFNELGLNEPILRALKAEGYTKPTPIQKQAIPIVLKGVDLLACAQTGTGKTAAFSVPILQLLAQNSQKGRKKTKTLILTPTRELAIQIGESLSAYGRHTPVRHTVIFGGVSQQGQKRALMSGVDIIVATPGRLLDLMNQGIVSLKNIETFVLDEADRMLDMGFIHDVKKILKHLPERRQTLFFSATMPLAIQKLSDRILHQPQKVAITPASTPAEKISQSVYHVVKKDKRALLLHLLKKEDIENALVFTRTKYGADKIAKVLNRAGISAEAIHGNKSQNARQRALKNFKKMKTRVLVATDIAARGIDVDELSHVINFELPNVPETYVHRIGRTGRAGASGIAISFCDAEEKAYLKKIRRLTNQPIPAIKDHPFKMSVASRNRNHHAKANQQ
ncbi:MAG: DEAD/DEAH box helicase [Bacteroidota bacterium]